MQNETIKREMKKKKQIWTEYLQRKSNVKHIEYKEQKLKK